MSNPSPIASHALEHAAEWLMRLSEGALSEQEHAQWQAWRNSHSDCERAWQRAERLLGKVGQVPPTLALASLDRPQNPQRRAALGRLAALLAAPTLAWAGWQLSQRQGWTADYRTGIGERHALSLTDGSQLTLNTDTAIDVRFAADQRLIVLRHGEILVDTAKALAATPRTLWVDTAQGRLACLGARFSVRCNEVHTQVVVLEGAVQITLTRHTGSSPVRLQGPQRAEFSADTIAPPQVADSSLTAWTRGMLMADNLRLDELVAELGRYSRGFVRCDPSVAELRASGAFPVDDRSRTLRMLALTYPIKVDSHLDGYWVLLSPA